MLRPRVLTRLRERRGVEKQKNPNHKWRFERSDMGRDDNYEGKVKHIE